jgi:hypothetical protein
MHCVVEVQMSELTVPMVPGKPPGTAQVAPPFEVTATPPVVVVPDVVSVEARHVPDCVHRRGPMVTLAAMAVVGRLQVAPAVVVERSDWPVPVVTAAVHIAEAPAEHEIDRMDVTAPGTVCAVQVAPLPDRMTPTRVTPVVPVPTA